MFHKNDEAMCMTQGVGDFETVCTELEFFAIHFTSAMEEYVILTEMYAKTW
jgi:hypothetical protein